MVVLGGFMVDCGGGFEVCSGFRIFFFFFYVASNTEKKIIFPKIIYICKHFTIKNNLQRNKQSLNDSTISFGST
jgi:hypothetical protein